MEGEGNNVTWVVNHTFVYDIIMLNCAQKKILELCLLLKTTFSLHVHNAVRAYSIVCCVSEINAVVLETQHPLSSL